MGKRPFYSPNQRSEMFLESPKPDCIKCPCLSMLHHVLKPSWQQFLWYKTQFAPTMGNMQQNHSVFPWRSSSRLHVRYTESGYANVTFQAWTWREKKNSDSLYLTNPLTSISLNLGQKGHREGVQCVLLHEDGKMSTNWSLLQQFSCSLTESSMICYLSWLEVLTFSTQTHIVQLLSMVFRY